MKTLPKALVGTAAAAAVAVSSASPAVARDHRGGIDDFTRRVTARLAAGGYLVAVPDVSHRVARDIAAMLGDLLGETPLPGEIARPERLVAAMRHGALNGGKRLRPLLVLLSAPEAGRLIARYVGADAVRLSPAALETLAIVAYRQPVTRALIERIRGVDSEYSIRALLHRRLIVELGRSEAPGRPFLYGTGFDFLERFGMTSLDELPPLEAELAARLVEHEDPTGEPTVSEEASATAEPA